MTPDPYDHMREAFHIVADGLMEWEDSVERPQTRAGDTRAYYRSEDVETLETAGESLSRAGDFRNAVAIWALALRVRQAVRDGS